MSLSRRQPDEPIAKYLRILELCISHPQDRHKTNYDEIAGALTEAADRIEALEALITPLGHIKIPTSRDEAEKMILVAQNYLEWNK